MRTRRATLAFLLLVSVLGPASAVAGGFAVDGMDRARMLPPAGAEVDEYRNAGYRLRWSGDEVVVEVEATPLGSASPYAPPERPTDDAVARLARAVATGARTEYEATSRLLGWLARNIDYDLDRLASQEPEAVLERRSGYCTGVARLAVALLRAVGLEAREVAGYVYDGGLGQPQGYHRWIEVRFDDLGWVFSDPLYSHHWVPANYLRLSSERLALDEGTEGLLIERHDTVTAVDVYPSAVPGIRARRNSDRQTASSLRVQVDGGGAGLAVLEGNTTRWTHALVAGATTFVGLEPGSYELHLELADGGRSTRRLDLARRQRTTLLLVPEHAPPRPPATDSETPRAAPVPSPVRRTTGSHE